MRPAGRKYYRECPICDESTPIRALCEDCKSDYRARARRARKERVLGDYHKPAHLLQFREYHMSLEEIAEVEGISRERVRQIEQQALAKLSRNPELIRLITNDGQENPDEFFSAPEPHDQDEEEQQ